MVLWYAFVLHLVHLCLPIAVGCGQCHRMEASDKVEERWVWLAMRSPVRLIRGDLRLAGNGLLALVFTCCCRVVSASWQHGDAAFAGLERGGHSQTPNQASPGYVVREGDHTPHGSHRPCLPSLRIGTAGVSLTRPWHHGQW